MGNLILDYQRPDAESRAVTGVERVVLALGVVLVPIAALILVAMAGHVFLLWQSPRWQDKLMALFSIWSSWPFYLLIAYSTGAALRYTWVEPNQAAEKPWVRLGIYTGLLLNLQYTSLAATAFLGQFLENGWSDNEARESVIRVAIATLVLPIITWLCLRLLISVRRSSGAWMTALTAGGLIIAYIGTVIAVSHISEDGANLLILPPFCGLPLWPLMAYARLSHLVWRTVPLTDSNRMSPALPAAWLGAYGVAWTASIAGAIAYYSSLSPTQRSLCYVATAATRGHRWLVRSREVRTSNGTILLNGQLRYLICAEIALHFVCPQLRRVVRGIYDRFGPRLAARLTTPTLADAGYLAMKPAEWAARLFLRILFQNPEAVVRQLHSAAGTSPSACDLPGQ